jgi:hypothetical protein
MTLPAARLYSDDNRIISEMERMREKTVAD